MVALRAPSNPLDDVGTTDIWRYARPLGSGAVELGIVRGVDVALPPHFHDEDQITFVVSGKRQFVIENELVEIGPDEGIHIPAGLVHRSRTEGSEVSCINVYTSPQQCGAVDLISSLARLRRRRGSLNWADLTIAIEQQRCATEKVINERTAAPSRGKLLGSVSDAAHLSGMSREGFSRRFRRIHGLPPQRFQLLERLNDARRLLRRGESIAEVAAQTGFADQSHLGRLFRRVFGVTPGRYRDGIEKRSHPF